MPIPKPNEGEDREEFVSRCMANDIMQTEYPDEQQRAGVCFSQWGAEKMKNALKFEKSGKSDIAKLLDVSEKEVDFIIDAWDEWAGSFTSCVDSLSGKPGITDPEALCAWMHHEATGEWPAEAKSEGAELTGMIVSKDKAKQIVYAPVLIPGEADADGEVVTKEKIEDVAHFWLSNFAQVDHSHSLNPAAKPVESYITTRAEKFKMPDNTVLEIPSGSWMMAAKVQNSRVWKGIMNGEFNGFSIMGIRSVEASPALKQAEVIGIDAVFKRTLLRDLGDEWFAPFVSIVKNPAVPKSKWVAIKSQGWGRAIMDDILAKIGISKSKDGGEEMDEKQVKEIVTTAVKDSVEPFGTRLQAIETEIKGMQEKLAPPPEGDDKDKDKDKAKEPDAAGKGDAAAGDGKDKDEGKDAEIADLKLKLADEQKFRKDVEGKLGNAESAAKSLTGQDGDGDGAGSAATKEKDPFPRDSYGRRIKHAA